MLPEEFPVVLIAFLAFGAWRMSQRNVLARRSVVIETLGETTPKKNHVALIDHVLRGKQHSGAHLGGMVFEELDRPLA